MDMSYREPYYVFPRKLKSGRKVFYYQAYLPDGSLSNSRSTGQEKIGAAKAYCRILLKEGRLIPQYHKKSMIFGNYYSKWWEWGKDPLKPTLCPYLTRRYLRGQKPSYTQAHISRLKFKRHIISYFGEMALLDI